MWPVSSLVLGGVSQGMIVVLQLSLKVVAIILCCIFLILLSDFRMRRPRSIPTPPMMRLTEFFHEDAEIKVHSLPISWYLISTSP